MSLMISEAKLSELNKVIRGEAKCMTLPYEAVDGEYLCRPSAEVFMIIKFIKFMKIS